MMLIIKNFDLIQIKIIQVLELSIASPLSVSVL